MPEEGAGRLREGPGMLAVVERAGEPGSHADEDIRAHTERVAAPAIALDTVTCTTTVISTSGRGFTIESFGALALVHSPPVHLD